MWGIMLPFTYSISKSKAISLIAYLKIYDEITLGNSFQELKINSMVYGLISIKIFGPIKIVSPSPSPCSRQLLRLLFLYLNN